MIEQVFNHVRQHQAPTKLVFDNQLVKQLSGTSFSNQFDVTKVDTSARLPQVLRDNDFFIAHLGGGLHQFIKGISVGFHQLEPIAEEDVIPWRYRRSVLNEADTSEANILALISNQQILHRSVSSGCRGIPRDVKTERKARVAPGE